MQLLCLDETLYDMVGYFSPLVGGSKIILCQQAGFVANFDVLCVVCCVALVSIYGVMEVLGRTMKIHWLPTF